MYRKAVPVLKWLQILSDVYYIQACKFPNGSKNHLLLTIRVAITENGWF